MLRTILLARMRSAWQSSRTGGGAAGGTLAYMAPEAFADEYVLASEVYSYAIILWELLTGLVPWSASESSGKGRRRKAWTQATLMHAVCHGTRPEIPPEADWCWKSL